MSVNSASSEPRQSIALFSDLAIGHYVAQSFKFGASTLIQNIKTAVLLDIP